MTAVLDSVRDDRAAVDKAFSLLVAFGDEASTGVGVSELARRASLSKSTAYRVLGMLERNAMVERIGTVPMSSTSPNCTDIATRLRRHASAGAYPRIAPPSARSCWPMTPLRWKTSPAADSPRSPLTQSQTAASWCIRSSACDARA
jgi:IclR helix-turn-helix domain